LRWNFSGDFAGLAQLVEHIIRNDGVECSIHSAGTISLRVQQFKLILCDSPVGFAFMRWTVMLIKRSVLFLASCLAVATLAAEPSALAPRLEQLQGEVWLSGTSQDSADPARVGQLLQSGDELRVGRDAHAQLTFSDTTFDLAGGSRLLFLDLGGDQNRFHLPEGALTATLATDADQQIIIETPNARIALLERGQYQLDVEDGGTATVVNVIEGQSEVASGKQIFALRSAQQGRYTDALPIYEEENAQPAREEYAYLDRYGSWELDTLHGNVWYPSHAYAGWSPYRYGRWSHIGGPWGWTWIDRSPWGLTPFNYGNWVYLRSRWCWVPGPRRQHPVKGTRPPTFAPGVREWHTARPPLHPIDTRRPPTRPAPIVRTPRPQERPQPVKPAPPKSSPAPIVKTPAPPKVSTPARPVRPVIDRERRLRPDTRKR
jgi:hypothetical protein